MDYQKAKEILNGRSHKTIAPNTVLHRIDKDSYGIQFYEKNILTFRKNGTILLRVDPKERTKTTKDRLNKFLGPNNQIFIKNGKWVWSDNSTFKSPIIIK